MTIVSNDSASTIVNTSIQIDVLANDISDTIVSVVSSVTQGSNGSVSIISDSIVEYTPNSDFEGNDSFTYTNDEGSTATVTISVSSASNLVVGVIIEQHDILTNRDNQSYNPDLDFLRELEKAIDDGFQNMKPSMDNIDITTPVGTFTIPPITDVILTSLNIATAVSNYWALTIIPSGVPQGICTVTPSAIISVVNTATSIISPLKDNLELSANNPQSDATYFEEFITIIFDAVKTIQWTVSELGTSGSASTPVPCPHTFVVTVT